MKIKDIANSIAQQLPISFNDVYSSCMNTYKRGTELKNVENEVKKHYRTRGFTFSEDKDDMFDSVCFEILKLEYCFLIISAISFLCGRS